MRCIEVVKKCPWMVHVAVVPTVWHTTLAGAINREVPIVRRIIVVVIAAG